MTIKMSKHAKTLQRQQGVALLVIMLIVALVTVLATEMVTRLQLNLARTVNIKANNQAYWYAMGAEEFAKKSLRDLRTLNPDTINLNQPWAKLFNYPIDGGGIQAQVTDMQACFNLNSLVTKRTDDGSSNVSSEIKIQTEIQAFNRLLVLTNSDAIDSFTADTVSESLADWLDEDSDLRSYGAEDGDYESLQFPYSAANSLMTNSSEFRLINGVDVSWLNLVLPYVCVLPNDSTLAVNVNTLEPDHAKVLAALTGLSTDAANRLISARPVDGYKNIADFLSEPELQDLNDTQKAWLTVKSNYFMLDIKTRYNGASFNMSTLFKVFNTDEVEVMSREFRSIN